MFSSSRERDLVQSFAANLANHNGKAGIRMELPEHLRGLFKLFKAHGAELRRKYPGLKRAIKYDDASQSLCMDVKMPDKNKWHKIGEVEMRDIARRFAASTGRKSRRDQDEQDEEDRRRILGLEEDEEDRTRIPVVPEGSGAEDE